MATYDQSGNPADVVIAAEALTEPPPTGTVTTDATGMQEISVTAQKIAGYDWSQWLKPPKIYYVGALAAAVLYYSQRKKR
jgi:hypothetical protein